MIQDKTKTLETVCKIANTYEVNPARVLNVYNRIMQQGDVMTQEEVLKITQRYIQRYFKPRINTITIWSYNEIVDFTKSNMKIRG